MTPQAHFMIVAAVLPAHETALRHLLASMNEGPGRVKASNALIPFVQFETLHFARLLMLDDQTTGDVRLYGLPVQTYPLYLAFLGDIDGAEAVFLHELAQRAPAGLRALFSCCEGFTQDTDLVDWMQQHRSVPVANYVNTRGRTVRQIREEAALRLALVNRLTQLSTALRGLPPREIHAQLARYIATAQSAGLLALSPPQPTPARWWFANLLHRVGMPILLLLASPLLLVIAPFYLMRLRHHEKIDPEFFPPVDLAYSDSLALAEDHEVTNQFSAMGSLKPGWLRLATTIGVLLTVNYAARHLVRPGRLGRIRTIHFARWTFIKGTRRMAFFSNYDGSVESYMDDFINKTGFGLNASFSNGIGYPRTRWLVLDGCADECKYKVFLRRHTLPTQVWYKAYPGLTAIDLERNTRIRRGLENMAMSDQQLREWLALL